jgi:hypothetical protein
MSTILLEDNITDIHDCVMKSSKTSVRILYAVSRRHLCVRKESFTDSRILKYS